MIKGHWALTEHEVSKNAKKTALPKFVTPGHRGKFNHLADAEVENSHLL
jgi:hypothetical protein